MKKNNKKSLISSIITVGLFVSTIPFNMQAQTTINPKPVQTVSLSKEEITKKVELLRSAVKQMNNVKTRMIANIAARIALGAIGTAAIIVTIAAATGGTGFAITSTLGLGLGLGTVDAILAGGYIGLISAFIGGAVAIGAGTAAELAKLVALSLIFKSLGEAIIRQKPAAFLLFSLPTRNAFRRLEGIEQREKELNELITLGRSTPGSLDKKQQKIVESFYKKLKDPFFVGAFRAFAEKNLLIQIVKKAIELDSSLRTIVKNDPEKTAKLIVKYVLLNRDFGNYMAALNELTYNKNKKEIFRLRGLARVKVQLQFKTAEKQIAKIERQYPQLIKLKNELVGMYRKEATILDKKYAEMLKK